MKTGDKLQDKIQRLKENNYCHGISLITGRANGELAKKVNDILRQTLDKPISKFPDGERRAIIRSDLRRKGVFIIHPTSPPNVNARLVELYAMLDAARRESPDEITAVIPYFGYARQDRREQPGAPIMSAVIAKQIMYVGAGRIITIDLHSEQTMAAVDKPWDNLYASKVLVPAILEYGIDPTNTVVATPDKGGFLRALKYAEMFGTNNIAIVYKRRDIDLIARSKALFMLGDVKGKTVIIPDDIVSTASTLVDAAEMMRKKGAQRIMAAITHGIFLKDPVTKRSALEKIEQSPIEKVFVTDSIRQKRKVKEHPKIEIVSVAELLADAIYHVQTGEHLYDRFS